MDDDERAERADERRAAILRAWTELGRPGARKVAAYMRKRGDDVSEKLVNQVLNRKTAQQVFRSQWKSEGRITATVRNDTWQADIMSYTSRDPGPNRGYRYAYVFVDVWSREILAVPARLKSPQMSIEAFHRAQIRLGWPKSIHMDGGGEWQGAFQAYMRRHGVQLVTRDQEHRNGLAIVDSAIARLRRAVSKEQIDEGGGEWVAPLLRAADGLNRRENRHLLGESPEEVRAPITAFALDAQAGRQILAQTRMLAALKDRLRRAGRFRVQVPDDERTKKSANPTFSGRIHEVRSIDQATVTDERGNIFRIWLVQPVEQGESIVFPKAVRPNEERDDHRREELEAFAAALKAHIGDGRMGALTAAAFLRTVPGFRGSVPELLRLFPEIFQVDGRGNNIIISVRGARS